MSEPQPLSERLLLAPGTEALPLLHGRMEFADWVRRSLLADPPDAICVELPATLESLYRRAVSFLPVLTVLVLEWEDGHPAFLTVSPQCGLAEAVRTGAELGIPVHFVDQDVRGYPGHFEAYPDPHLLRGLGPATYVRAVTGVDLPGTGPSPGAKGADTGAREAGWPDTGETGLHGFESSALDRSREQTMAHHLQRLVAQGKRVVWVGGLLHLCGLADLLAGPPVPRPLARVRERPGELFALGRETVTTKLCLGEAPHLVAAFELNRRVGVPPLDRVATTAHLLELARERYRGETGEEVTPHSLRVLGQYGRNLARLQGHLVPDLFTLVTAARGAVDENYGHAVLELGTTYPFWDQGRLRVRELSEEELEWARARSLRVFPRLTRPRDRPFSAPMIRRRREQRKGQWQRDFESTPEGQCSYPPEDLVIESYGERLKDRARRVLSESGARTLPFTTSPLDGVDVRETLRNWHEGRIYVREAGPAPREVGSVVFLFEDGPEVAGRYPWRMTWWGEHDQESDMSFYATRPEDQVTGPGVARCEYGGFLMTFPPGRLAEVWSDPFYDSARTPGERLVMAGIEYSLESHVVVVASRPPASRLHSLAERFGRKLVYLPLGTLSPSRVREVRVFHVLANQGVREIAGDYVW